MNQVPQINLQLIEDKQPQDDIVIEREFDNYGHRYDWLPEEIQPGFGFFLFGRRNLYFGDEFCYRDYGEFNIRGVENYCSEDWVKEALFTQEDYDQAAWLDDTSNLAFLYYCPSAASKRPMSTFNATFYCEWGHEINAPHYENMVKRFEPWLKDKIVFGQALIVPFDYAV